jgi:multidrug efflux system membrane fusion protein
MTRALDMTTSFQRHRLSWAVATLAVVGAGLWFWSGHAAQAADADGGKKGKRPAEGPVQVTTVPVRQQDMPVYRSGIGSVAPMFSVTVKARVDGELDRVGFTEGQDVRKGQLLAQLDPRTLQAALLQAQATKAKDEATLANARADLQRYTTLLAQDAATPQQVDTQKALVRQLEATVKADDAAVNAAQVQLGFTTITAPISGRAGARLVDPGNIVHASDTAGLVVINQIDPIAVTFTLPEDAVQDTIHALDKKQPLVVQAFQRDGSRLLGAGTLVLLNNQIDTTTGTVQLKASFPNPQHNLWPGQFVNVRLQLGVRAKALVVPESAVQRSQTGLYAYVVDDQTQVAQSHTITVTQIQDGTAVIASGLEAGERVVVDGQYKLKPGSHVVESARGASAPASVSASGAGK